MSKIKDGFYSAVYFQKTAKILKIERPNDIVTMQFFQRSDNVKLCGINECVDLIRQEAFNPETLEVWSLADGDLINANEPVLKIIGHYSNFGHLEGLIDGILARQTSIATNCYRVLQAAPSKGIIFMNDRNDYYYNQATDGYAAYIGGIRKFVTAAQVSLLPEKLTPMGTVPHALIQAFNGDLVSALEAYQKHFPTEELVALVDYNNDVINDSLLVAKTFPKLAAVRVDTSQALTDKYFLGKEEQYLTTPVNGVSKELIQTLRKVLDENGYNGVKIIVSSGFTAEKIAMFEAVQVPVDIYGVGQSLAKLSVGFTGDLVILNNVKQAKFGRNNIETKRLVKR
ncbi:nicotinate phosphoribosyltransferase [Spiroplasma chrysopicola]|uniref:nicotinate phosphoribosyltransferase n=1 Tax=Spiroplasma chrysopicola DF-1 TaxID=1276227 RepID=R4UJF3_9MOLU|nr:nicotinate phosphoribosyltransferase [Spiroplasma chrysopicola]AGM25441.1 nicotinate phosphoribosyltransferase [Spiroplasma chrysopicola DF-1]